MGKIDIGWCSIDELIDISKQGTEINNLAIKLVKELGTVTYYLELDDGVRKPINEILDFIDNELFKL